MEIFLRFTSFRQFSADGNGVLLASAPIMQSVSFQIIFDVSRERFVPSNIGFRISNKWAQDHGKYSHGHIMLKYKYWSRYSQIALQNALSIFMYLLNVLGDFCTFYLVNGILTDMDSQWWSCEHQNYRKSHYNHLVSRGKHQEGFNLKHFFFSMPDD